MLFAIVLYPVMDLVTYYEPLCPDDEPLSKSTVCIVEETRLIITGARTRRFTVFNANANLVFTILIVGK